MKIGDVARRTGASVRSLRHYEEVGLIETARTASGYRDFDADTVQLVRRIRRMIGLGFSTAEITSFLPSIVGEKALATQCVAVTAAHRAKLREIEDQIAELERRRAALLSTLQQAVGERPELRSAEADGRAQAGRRSPCDDTRARPVSRLEDIPERPHLAT